MQRRRNGVDMRQYRRVIGVLLDHHEDVHVPSLVLGLPVLRDCLAFLPFHCSSLLLPDGPEHELVSARPPVPQQNPTRFTIGCSFYNCRVPALVTFAFRQTSCTATSRSSRSSSPRCASG